MIGARIFLLPLGAKIFRDSNSYHITKAVMIFIVAFASNQA